jgi:GWxTD domain-containing protein
MKKAYLLIVFFILLISFTLMKGDIKAYQEKEDFLSVVRYIITDEETNIFKQYPPSEREEFIEKFWARRDPTPATPKNEFKEEYYNRIEEANNLFKGGIAGWLQDRGQVYILFGPPDEKIQNPGGGRNIDPYAPAHEQVADPMHKEHRDSLQAGEKPSETWVYYKLLASSQITKIDFVDTYNTGNYKLSTSIEHLTAGLIEALISPNLTFIHELAKQESQIELEQALLMKRTLFNFKWDFIKKKDRKENSNLLIQLEIPFERILYQEIEGRLVADIEVFAEIRDSKQNLTWDFYKTYNLSMTPIDLDSKKDSNLILKIPVTAWLKKGKYSIYMHLTNLSANQEVKKLLNLKM